MNDYEYLEKLPLSDKQKQDVREQGTYKTAAQLYDGVVRNHHDFKRWLYPLDIEAIRGILWQMMTEAERQPYLPRKESTAERVGGVVAALVAVGFLFFLFASCAGGCSKMLFR